MRNLRVLIVQVFESAILLAFVRHFFVSGSLGTVRDRLKKKMGLEKREVADDDGAIAKNGIAPPRRHTDDGLLDLAITEVVTKPDQ